MTIRWFRVNATLAACAVAAISGFLAQAGPAHAEAFGELHQTGEFGPAKGQLNYPSDLAVDQEDNSVFVVDAPEGQDAGIGPEKFRIQKWSSSLSAPVAEGTVATPIGAGGTYSFVAGIAVDPSLHRLYVLKSTQTSSRFYKWAGEEILAYSTETLLPETLQPGGNDVIYSFPAPTSTSIPPNVLGSPVDIAVDPSTHDLVVLGSEDEGHALIQKISSTGGFLEPFDDTKEELNQEGVGLPTGIAVGPDGTLYLTVTHSGISNFFAEEPGVVELSSNFSTATVTAVHQDTTESPELTGGLGNGNGRDYGPQVAVSADGSLVYAAEVRATERQGVGHPNTAGSYEIRGMSTADGSQQIVFGGAATTSTSCLIASEYNAIAAGSDGVVYALDEGGSESGVPTAFGFHLIEFGPGGSGCPTPSAKFKIGSDESEAAVKVQKGQTVTFEALAAGLNGEEPVELEWDLNGSGAYATKVTGSPASLTVIEKFLKPGLYTIGLKIFLKNNGSYGNPPPVTRKIEVVAPPPTASFEASTLSPKPGEAVTFNGAESLDPAGSPTGTPTHTLKSYTWSFGDGSPEVTTETAEVAHAFANPAAASLPEIVTLKVTNEEEVQSTPTTQTLTIQGTTAPGGGGGGSVISTPLTPQAPGVQPPSTKPPVTIVKPLTNTQKLANALKACKRIKSKKSKAKCETQAKKKYAPKAKKKHKTKH